MADKEAKIKFKAETSEFQSEIKSTNSTMSSLRSEMKLNEAQFQNSGNKVEYLEQKQKLLESQLAANQSKQSALNSELQVAASIYGKDSQEVANLEKQLNYTKAQEEQLKGQLSDTKSELEANSTATAKLTETISKQESELSSLKDEYVEAVLAYGENSDEAKELADQIDDLSQELAENKSTMANAEDAAEQLDKSLEDVSESSEETGGKFDALTVAAGNLIANGLQRAATAAKDFVTDSIEVGKNFDSAMSNVAALSGATGDELEMLRDTAKEFGSTTMFSASEASDALGYMALAGWDANTSASALGGVLNLAAASGMELGAASDMVTDYLSAFSLEADQSTYFADLLAYAQANANTTAEGLGGAYKNCAANMNAAGQDIETTTAMLSMMANQGLKGEKAGTALTAVMRDMTSKMQDGSIKIGDTSVAVMDAEGNFRDLTDILFDVEAATNGMGDAERATALQSTFTADSIKGLNLLLNAGVGEAAAFEAELRESAGTAQETADVMQNNLGGDLTSLGSQFEGVQIALYEKFEPALRSGVDALSGLLDVLGWIIDNGETVIGVIASLAVGLGAYLAYTTALKVMEGGFMALSVVQKASAAAQWLLNAAMSANPIGVVIAVIAALVAAIVLLWNNCEGFRNAVMAVWEAIQTAIGTVVDWFMANAMPIIQTVVDAIVGFFTTLGEVASTVWNAIYTVINTVVMVIVAVIATYLDAIFAVWSAIWNAVLNFITPIWNGIRNTISTVINAIRTVISSVMNAISSVWSSVWNTVWGVATSIWNGIRNTISTVINAVKTVVSSVVNAISSTVSSVFNAIWNTVTNIWNGIKNAIMTPINAARDAVSNAINAIKGFFNFKIEWPHIPMPHFGVDPSGWQIGDLLQGVIPKLKIDFYAAGGILTRPTIFGMNGDALQVGGEAGREAVLPIDTLQTYIDAAFQRNLSDGREIEKVVSAIERLDNGLGKKIADNAPDAYPGDRAFRTALRKAGVSVQ